MADNQFINFNSQDVADMYRRNQYARMLQDQANAPIERPSYKGIEAPLHATQGVAKLTAALLAGYQQNQMDKSYAKEKADAEQKLVDEQERRRGEVAEYSQGFGPETAYTNAAGGDVNNYTPQTQMTSTPRSPAQLLAHELSGMGSDNELIRNMARASSERRGAEAQEKTRLDERAQNRLDKEAEIKRIQDNADREFNQRKSIGDKSNAIALERLRQGRLPTAAAQEKAAEKEQGATNAATTIKQLREDYNSLNKIGGIRNLNQNVAGRSAASLANVLPYALQNKDAAMLRERIDANIESLVGPLMRASGMSTQMLNSNVERAAFMRTLGGTNTSLETNMSILDRMNDTLNYDPKKKDKGDVPDNTDAKLKSVMDMYAPPKVK